LPTQAFAFLAVFAVFVYATHTTHATQATAFEWKPGFSVFIRPTVISVIIIIIIIMRRRRRFRALFIQCRLFLLHTYNVDAEAKPTNFDCVLNIDVNATRHVHATR